MIDPQRRVVTIGVRGWLIAAAVVAGVVLVWQIVASALSTFVLLFAAILFVAGLQPIVDRLRRRMPLGAAVGIAFGGVLVALALIVYFLTAPLVAELQQFLRALPGFLNALQSQVAAAQHFARTHALAQQIASNLASSAGAAVAALGAHALTGPALVLTIFSDAIVILLLAFGWAFAAEELRAFVLSLLPPKAKEDWRLALDIIASRMSAYVQGVVLNGAIVGVVVGAALALLSVPYAMLLAFIVAVLQAIPMVGAVISGVILLLAVLATSGWTKMIVVLVVLAIVQVLDQNVLSPVIFGKRVQLSFLLIILSTVVGGTLLGIPGAFLGVPAAAVVQVIVQQIVAPAIRRANQVDAPDA